VSRVSSGSPIDFANLQKSQDIPDIQLVDNSGASVESELDRHALQAISDCGYPQSYIRESLLTDQMNYVTTHYNLIVTKYEY
jgi:N-formylglutamate amidohydrolase